MRGTIRQRGRTWTAYWWLKNEDGKLVQQSKGGFATKRAAQERLTEELGRVHRGESVRNTKLTVGQYLVNEWLPASETRVRPSTLASYRLHVEHYIKPRLGGIRLQGLTGAHLNAAYKELLTAGRTGAGQKRVNAGGALSPTTVRHVHATMHRALKDAMRWNLVTRNVADAADPPKATARRRREITTWTQEELQAFLAHVADDRLFAAYALAAATGMRRGEVLGLRWSDVDLEAGRLSVRQTLLAIEYELEWGEPKTERGRRSIPLDTRAVAILRAHRARQNAERLQLEGYGLSVAEENGPLVFALQDGTPVHPDGFTDTFEKHVKDAGLRRIRLHDVRHSFATLALQAGVPVQVVSEILGHSTPAFTMSVYQHVVPSMQEEAAEKVAALVFGPV